MDSHQLHCHYWMDEDGRGWTRIDKTYLLLPTMKSLKIGSEGEGARAEIAEEMRRLQKTEK